MEAGGGSRVRWSPVKLSGGSGARRRLWSSVESGGGSGAMDVGMGVDGAPWGQAGKDSDAWWRSVEICEAEKGRECFPRFSEGEGQETRVGHWSIKVGRAGQGPRALTEVGEYYDPNELHNSKSGSLFWSVPNNFSSNPYRDPFDDSSDERLQRVIFPSYDVTALADFVAQRVEHGRVQVLRADGRRNHWRERSGRFALHVETLWPQDGRWAPFAVNWSQLWSPCTA